MAEYFYIKKFVDAQYKEGELNKDHETIANEFLEGLKKFSDKDFVLMLMTATYIPDFYDADSSPETLFSKLVEVMVAEWALRLGFNAELLKEKSSKEDVKIMIGDYCIVTDAKTYRLGRSQPAPNPKDFVKLEDVRKWMGRYTNALGGLVTYPDRHEWKGKSDVYQYCTTKEAPTVMLSYKHLAYLLFVKKNYNPSDILELWDYNRIFPESIPAKTKGGNKYYYWRAIEAEIIRITNSTQKKYNKFMSQADAIIDHAINKILKSLNDFIQETESKVLREIQKTSDEEIRAEYTSYKIAKETEEYRRITDNAKSFRLNKK